ncbi:MAG: phosphoesterase [Chloroflexi bacterium]|nr:phosphoesterase [Chloroflexota bacterium]MBI3734634.1 phosphoesterase [Chloroflexota bacterium]
MRTRFMFTTDLHGSETCWRKFLNSAKMFNLDALVMSGDMTGKLMVPIIKRADGRWDATFLGKDEILEEQDIPEFEKKCRLISYIPYRCDREEARLIASNEQYREDLFERQEGEIVKVWLGLIKDRVPDHVKIIISPGNDDKFSIDDILRNDKRVNFGEEEVIRLDEEHEVMCVGWANRTPFDSPRECSEEELEQKLEATAAKVLNVKTSIFCLHVPPKFTHLDDAPMVDKDLRPVVQGGRMVTIPAGSTAVRKIIQKYQPLASLHGHIHESPGATKIGRTQCLNPGSEYSEGIFKGYLVEVTGDKITKLQRVEA